MGGSPAASAAARLSQRSDEPSAVLQHGSVLADRGQTRCRTEPVDRGADHDSVLDDAGARRARSGCCRQRRPRRGDRLFPPNRASGPADRDPARPVSPIAWLPVAIFIFGIGNGSAIFMVFIALFFHMIVQVTMSREKRAFPPLLGFDGARDSCRLLVEGPRVF